MRQSSLYKHQLSGDVPDCYLCRLHGLDYEELLCSALYHKYSEKASFKMYYHIDCMIRKVRTRFVSRYSDQECLDNQQERLTEYYPTAIVWSKLGSMCDYYQFSRSMPQCHLKRVQLIVEKHKHLHLKLYYRNVKMQLNMTAGRSTSEECTSQSDSSSAVIGKCSCMLCGISKVQDNAPSQQILPQTQSKALQSVYEVMNGCGLDSQNYLHQRFMFKKSHDTSRAFQSYLKAREHSDINLKFSVVNKSSRMLRIPSVVVQVRDNVENSIRVKNYEKSNSIRKLIQDKLKESYGSTHLPQTQRLPKNQDLLRLRRASAFESGSLVRISKVSNSKEKRQSTRPLPEPKILLGKATMLIKREASCGVLPRPGILRADQIFIRRTNKVMSLENLHERLPSATQKGRSRVSPIMPLRSGLKQPGQRRYAPQAKAIKLNTRAIYQRLRHI